MTTNNTCICGQPASNEGMHPALCPTCADMIQYKDNHIECVWHSTANFRNMVAWAAGVRFAGRLIWFSEEPNKSPDTIVMSRKQFVRLVEHSTWITDGPQSGLVDNSWVDFEWRRDPTIMNPSNPMHFATGMFATLRTDEGNRIEDALISFGEWKEEQESDSYDYLDSEVTFNLDGDIDDIVEIIEMAIFKHHFPGGSAGKITIDWFTIDFDEEDSYSFDFNDRHRQSYRVR